MANPLVGKTPELPFDLQTEESQLAIQQAIAMELLKQGMAPVPPVLDIGGTAIGNWGNIGASASQTHLAEKQLSEVGRRQGVLAGEYTKRVADALARVNDLLTGNVPGAAPGAPAGQPDQMAAAKYAASTGLPPLTKFAEERYKGYPTGKELLESSYHYDPASQADFMRNLNPTGLQPATQYHESEGVGTFTQGPNVLSRSALDPAGPITAEPLTGLPGQTGAVTNRFRPFSQQYSPYQRENVDLQGQLKKLEGTYTQAKDANESLRSINQLEEDLKGMPENQFGSFAPFRHGVDKFVEMLGGDKVNWAADHDVIAGTLDNLMASRLKMFAPVTDKDVNVARGMFGRTDFTLDGLKRMLAYVRDVSNNVTLEHDKNVQTWAGSLRGVSPEQKALIIQSWTPVFKQSVLPSARPSKNPYSGKTDAEIQQEIDKARAVPPGAGGSGRW